MIIPASAQDYINETINNKMSTKELMIEFAKKHVEAALKTAASIKFTDVELRQDILESYPLKNIK